MCGWGDTRVGCVCVGVDICETDMCLSMDIRVLDVCACVVSEAQMVRWRIELGIGHVSNILS